jgi:predicted ATPase
VCGAHRISSSQAGGSVQTDVTKEADIQAAVTVARKEFGRLDKGLETRDAEFCEFHGRAFLPRARIWIIAYYSTKLPSFWLTNRAGPATRTTCRMIRHRRLRPERVGERKVLG